MAEKDDQSIGFTPDTFIIPGQVMTDPDLQPLDATVYAIIYWLERLKDGRCYASNATIAKVAKSSASGVSHSLSRLAKKHYIVLGFNEKNHRTHIVCCVTMGKRFDPAEHKDVKTFSDSNTTLAQTSKGGSSNERGGVAQTSYRDSNTKKESITSETQSQIKKVYGLYLLYFVVDAQERQYAGPDARPALLTAAAKRYKLTDKRRDAIRRRLNDSGFPDCMRAIKNCSKSDFHRGDNERNWRASLEWILGSVEKVEEWANKTGVTR